MRTKEKDILIKSADISVVLQGPIEKKYVHKSIASIRKHLPNSEIILSTWRGMDTSNLDVDLLIENDDPGAICDDVEFKRPLNINRWIISSEAGVKKASRKYVLKARSDIEIENLDFLSYWDSYAKAEESFKLAMHKIIIPSVYTLRYLGDVRKRAIIYTPFHVSDWYCFGLKEDILEFVSCKPIENLRGFARYYANKTYLIPAEYRWWMNNWLRRMAPEQYIGLEYAKKKLHDIKIVDVFNYSENLEEISDHFLISNFIVLDPLNYGIHIQKFGGFTKKINTLNNDLWSGLLRQHVYERIYGEIFDEAVCRFDIEDFYRLICKLRKRLFVKYLECYKGIRRICASFIEHIREKIQRHPILHIISFDINHVLKGHRVYKTIKRKYKKENIKICPYRGTGDSYLVGNYYASLDEENVYVVPRDINRKILSYWGLTKIVVLKEMDMTYLQQYQRIRQLEDIQILHFSSSEEQSNVGYNLAGFRRLNFFDMYDYQVFKSNSLINIRAIPVKNKELDLLKYGVVKGKTVVIAPYSDSINSLPTAEWEYIVHRLIDEGFNVVTNCGSDSERAIRGTKPIAPEFDEIVPLLDYCGYFVSIRSGLCDIACKSTCKKAIWYPSWINYKYGRYIDFFTLNIAERDISAMEYEFEYSNNRKVINKMINDLVGGNND